MSKLFSMDSPVTTTLTRAANLMILNLLWLLCCAPLVTAGASTAAMFTVARNLAQDSCCSIFKPFFAAFRDTFWKATGLFLLCLTAGCILIINILAAGSFPMAFRILSSVPLILFLLSYGYVFPLLARFENTVFGTLKNALILGLGNPLRSIPTAALTFLPLVLALLFPGVLWMTLPFWLLMGFSLISYLTTLLLRSVFAKYLPPEPETEP